LTHHSNQPIGIFDSGIGGLTVANAIVDTLENEHLIYFGDTAHLPYGDKSSDSIKHYSEQITKFLLDKNCKAIVIACNTASSFAYHHIKNLFHNDIPIINVIDPIVDFLLSNQDIGKVGIIGTKGTIMANKYGEKLQEANKNINVRSLATPLFAPMIEEGFIDCEISKMVIQQYLSDPLLNDIQALVLACTHYPIIKEEIVAFYEQKVEVIDSASVVARYAKKILGTHNLLNTTSDQNEHHFYVSDYTDFFAKTTRRFFKNTIHLEHNNLWDN